MWSHHVDVFGGNQNRMWLWPATREMRSYTTRNVTVEENAVVDSVGATRSGGKTISPLLLVARICQRDRQPERYLCASIPHNVTVGKVAWWIT